jgi:hypothetical protein
MSTENTDFMSIDEIQSFLKDITDKPWQKLQKPKLNDFTNEWFNWYHRRKNGEDNVFRNAKPPIYFVEGLPFESPHFKRFFFKGPASLLVPLYSFSASLQEYPSLEEPELLDLIKKDLLGIDWDSVEATLDEDLLPYYPVIRKKTLTIEDITPADNPIRVFEETINVYHGGFWILIEHEPDLPPGDHLLYLKANSKTYEMEAKFLINATY